MDVSCSRNSILQVVPTLYYIDLSKQFLSSDPKPPVREGMYLWRTAESSDNVPDAGDHDVSGQCHWSTVTLERIGRNVRWFEVN